MIVDSTLNIYNNITNMRKRTSVIHFSPEKAEKGYFFYNHLSNLSFFSVDDAAGMKTVKVKLISTLLESAEGRRMAIEIIS